MDRENQGENYSFIGPETFLSKVRIGLKEVSELSGVSISRLQYWLSQGYIEPAEESKGTTERFKYGYETVRKANLIKQLIGQVGNLQKASQKADEIIEAMNNSQKPELSEIVHRYIRKKMLEKADEIFWDLVQGKKNFQD